MSAALLRNMSFAASVEGRRSLPRHYPPPRFGPADTGSVRSVAAAAILLTCQVARAGDLPAEIDGVEKIEDLSLEELLEQPIVAASNVAQLPKDSPAVVSVLDGDDLRRIGARDVGEAMSVLRGVYATNDRNYSYLGIRGFSIPGDYNTRLLLTIGDHKTADPVYGQATTGVELGLPLDAIQQIELVRGAASSTYGSSALLGAVQLVTSTGASRPGLHVSATTTATAETYGDPSHRPPVALYGQQVGGSYGVVTSGGTDVFAAASYQRDPGLSAIYIPSLAGNAGPCVDEHRTLVACDGVVRGIDHQEAGSAFVDIHRDGFRLSGLFSSRMRQIPTASFMSVIGDPGTRTVDNRGYLDAGYHAAAGELEFDGHASWDRYDYHGDYAYYDAPADGDPSYLAGRHNYHDAALADWLTGEARVRWRRGALVRGLSDVDTVAGAEVVAVPRATQVTDTLHRTDQELQVAAFGQAEARIAERVVTSLGGRVDDRPGSFGASTSARLGLLFDTWADGHVRATYGTAFRAPNLYERYYFRDQPLAPTLQPERARSLELSVEQYLGDHLRISTAVYRNDLSALTRLVRSGLPGLDADDDYVIRNVGEASATGVEGEVEARWHGTVLRGNLALQHATDETGADLPNSPRALGNVALVAPIAAGRARLAITSSYVGRRYAPSGAAIDGAFRTDLAIEIPRLCGGPLSLGAGISNAFDQRASVPGSDEHRETAIPEDPRLVWIRIGANL